MGPRTRRSLRWADLGVIALAAVVVAATPASGGLRYLLVAPLVLVAPGYLALAILDARRLAERDTFRVLGLSIGGSLVIIPLLGTALFLTRTLNERTAAFTFFAMLMLQILLATWRRVAVSKLPAPKPREPIRVGLPAMSAIVVGVVGLLVVVFTVEDGAFARPTEFFLAQPDGSPLLPPLQSAGGTVRVVLHIREREGASLYDVSWSLANHTAVQGAFQLHSVDGQETTQGVEIPTAGVTEADRAVFMITKVGRDERKITLDAVIAAG